MTDFMMDVDGPEFLLELNHQIAEFREQDVTAGPTIVESNEWNTYYQEPTLGMSCDYRRIAVLDTNFLISNLGYLKALTAEAELQPGSLLVIVPWIVVQELDGLKMRNKIQGGRDGGGNVGDLARIAMRFLEDALRKKRMWLRGQKTDEIFDRNARLTKGDDSILDCCRYFQQIVRPVTLFTNDRNLAIKAMIHEITSLSSENKAQMMEYASALAPPTPHYHEQQQHVQVTDADGDVEFMDMDESEDVDVAAAIQQNYGVYASNHAPTNYVPAQRQPSTKKSATKYYNASLYNAVYNNKNSSASNYDTRRSSKKSAKYSFKNFDDKPVRDRNGEILVPPSSSAGRLEEIRKKKIAQSAINPSLRRL
ncbi:PIN domain-containing protein [Fennellomyces sp. T-0311]|nr:PIN domain-containing protein [Fennellomyces sp. T-0311]